ncbi:hypothetical protein ACFCV3_09100 [Kribbella sp. NPDC056345]|uniref:hypothetical protein n=1 Tax=Kribbella sp. NPDC056345 TaxID=3345789 RepID=UPI0035DC0955
MRKFVVIAASAAVLSAGLQAPAWAGAQASPTNVEIVWTPDTDIRLSWQDQGEGNTVQVEYENPHRIELVRSVTAAEGNEVILPAKFDAADRVRLLVSTSDGLSVATPTAWFDTRRPPPPGLYDALETNRQGTNLYWKGEAGPDSTPNDALDNPYPYVPVVRAVVDLPGTATETHTFKPGQTSAALTRMARPAAIRLIASNEWGETPDTKIVRLGTMGAGISVPASAVYGNRLGIKSTLDLFTSEGREERASGIKVELQARAKSTDAWKTYGRYAGNTTAAFDTGIASLGNREYRLWVPARKVVSGNVIALTSATSTSARSSKTLIKFVSRGFTPAVARRGANVDLSARISPASTVKARLQFWDGRNWLDAGPLQFNKGYALQHGSAGDEPGTERYRITVPAVVVNGLTVSATTSSAFTLTTR